MIVTITGGTGLIGSALAESLLAGGHQVIIVSRNPERVPTRYQSASWHLESLTSAISSSQALINLAGESMAGTHPLQMRWTRSRKASILSSRVESGQKILQALDQVQNKPEVLIQASAIGYYGSTGQDPVDEKSPPGDDFLAQVCLAWESSTAEAASWGLRRVVLRTGLVLSQKGGLLPLLSLPFRFYLGGKLGSGEQAMSWIHIADMVGSIQALLADPSCQGSYNLTAPTPATNQEFAQTLGQVLGSPAWFSLPAPALRLALGQAATLALEGRQVLPARLLEAGYDFKFSKLGPALEDLLG